MVLGADPDDLERLASAHEVCAVHLARLRSRLRAADRSAWVGTDARRWWSTLDESLIPSLVLAGNVSASAARRLRSQAREQRLASLADPSTTTVRYRGDGDGRWVGRVGPAGADVVIVVVPGVGTALADAARLRSDAEHLWRVTVSHAGSAAHMGPTATDRIAVLPWLGYDPPDNVVVSLDRRPATSGAETLVADVAELRAGGARRVVVVGHSYGALVATGASAMGMAADELVLLGAPGLGVARPSELELGNGARLWAAAARLDPIAAVARAAPVHGPDPVPLALALPTSLLGHVAYLRDPVLLDALATLTLDGSSSPEGLRSEPWDSR